MSIKERIRNCLEKLKEEKSVINAIKLIDEILIYISKMDFKKEDKEKVYDAQKQLNDLRYCIYPYVNDVFEEPFSENEKFLLQFERCYKVISLLIVNR